MSAFVQQWGLNQDAEAKLRQLTPDGQAVVMGQFSVPQDLPDHQKNGKFIMFCSSVDKRMKGIGKGGKGFSPY
jgi:hypothetical protein